MLAEAAGFALLAAISPTALLVMAVFLGSANPRLTALMYVAGAVIMTVAMAVALLFALRAAGFSQPRQQEPRYGLRLGLGVICLAGGAFMAARPRGARAAGGEGAKGPGLIGRLTARPKPLTAFAAGLLLFAPSATFIAAVQVVATADATVAVTVAAVVVVVVITALTVWLPLLAYIAYPDATTRALNTANQRLRAHGRTLVTGALLVAGTGLVIDGALGLWG